MATMLPARTLETGFASALGLLASYIAVGDGRPLVDADAYASLRQGLAERDYYSPETPRALLVGKFKAGKSTLINALLGGKFAPVGFFEMTAWLARYWPSRERACWIRRRDGSIEDLPVERFVQLGEQRELASANASEIVAVDVATGITELKVSLVDLPGSGGLREGNEKLLVDSLGDADLAMWIVDAGALGDAREAALIGSLLETGTPLVAVLTKCDSLGPGEAAEAEAFLRQLFPRAGLKVFAVAAQATGDPGTSELRAYLNGEMSSRGRALRQQALVSHMTRMRDLVGALLDKLEEGVNELIAGREKFVMTIEAVRDAVEASLEDDVRRFAGGALFDAAQRQELSQAVGRAMKKSGSEDELQGVMAEIMTRVAQSGRAQEIASKAAAQANETWQSRLGDQVAVLESACIGVGDELVRRLQLHVREHQIPLEAGQEANQRAGAIMKLAAAGSLVGTMGALAQMSLVMAVTGVGIPIAVAGAVAAGIFQPIFRQHAIDRKVAETAEMMESQCAIFLEEQVCAHFLPRLRDANAAIAANLIADFDAEFAPQLGGRNAEQARSEIAACRALLCPAGQAAGV